MFLPSLLSLLNISVYQKSGFIGNEYLILFKMLMLTFNSVRVPVNKVAIVDWRCKQLAKSWKLKLHKYSSIKDG